MANAIKTSLRIEIIRENVNIRTTPLTQTSVATTSELYSDNTQVVGTSHELIAAGDVTDDAIAIIENLHATATVTIGGDSGGSFVPWIDIPAGYPAAVLPQVATLASTYLKSSVASTSVRVTLVKIVAPV